ncbi:ABC transporter substrate-binding protein [Aeromicrobium sp. UC242_57]|uniref:ABC transporter substrate-binding protein n=1 Tax=Aeromicrobium sp. UC242_57 TaxID=3374624 RepID=UPI0037AE3F66
MPSPSFTRTAAWVLCAGLATSALTACGTSDSPARDATTRGAGEGSTTYPLTIKNNCGTDVTIEAAPQRAVSVNQGSTEILLSLGLGDRMVGTSTWTDEIRPNLAKANATVPRLGDNAVSYERVLQEEPDIVTASFGGSLNDEDPDRRAQYAKLGVPTYVAPSHCDGRTDESGDGPRDHPLEMDVIYQEITELRPDLRRPVPWREARRRAEGAHDQGRRERPEERRVRRLLVRQHRAALHGWRQRLTWRHLTHDRRREHLRRHADRVAPGQLGERPRP